VGNARATLDEAFNQLPDSDRGVLVLRFVQRKPMREVGEALGTTEAAAKMRVGRALTVELTWPEHP
jgi:DNA-directed RNA polymerase specialized sigma24 family protein